jgi:hypothetical protein
MDIHEQLAADLHALLGACLPGIDIRVEHSERWQRLSVVFRWEGFRALLPEERFERLTRIIPTRFRRQRLRGFVWLELAPGQTMDEFLALPRSDEVADRGDSILRALVAAGLLDRLSSALGSYPRANCTGGFSLTERTLCAGGWTAREVTDAKLFFIMHGAYCDCQAAVTLRPAPSRPKGAAPRRRTHRPTAAGTGTG